MAIAMKAKARQSVSVSRVGEGQDVYLRSLRDGSLIIADLFQALTLEGRVFSANVGTVTSAITFGAGDITVIEPDLVIQVPSGTTILPISLTIQIQAFGNEAICEMMAAVGVGGGGTLAVTGGSTPTVANLRSDAPFASLCTVKGGVDSGATYMTDNVSEFWRDGVQKAVTKTTANAAIGNLDWNKFTWSAAKTGVLPVLVGAGCLMAYCAANASTGFITCVWAELPTSAIS